MLQELLVHYLSCRMYDIYLVVGCCFVAWSPICSSAWVSSTGHLSSHSDPVLHTLWEGRDQQVLPSGVSALQRSFSFRVSSRGQSLWLTICQKNETLYLCVCGCWKLCGCDLRVCLWWGQMACGSNPKWNRPSFVGDINDIPRVIFKSSCCSRSFWLDLYRKWNLPEILFLMVCWIWRQQCVQRLCSVLKWLAA